MGGQAGEATAGDCAEKGVTKKQRKKDLPQRAGPV